MGNLNYVAPVFRVTDVARSLAYYQDQLGFEVSFNYDNFYAGVVREGCHVHLKQAAPPERDQAAFEAAEHLDACFEATDAQGLASKFTYGQTVMTTRMVIDFAGSGPTRLDELKQATAEGVCDRRWCGAA